MQFDNQKRITPLQKNNIAFINDYLTQYVATSRYAKSVSCETAFDNEDYISDFILECDGFFAVLQYDSFETLTACFDIKLVYYGCDYRFSVYDIFNLFDIQDFRKYYYTDCIDSDTIKRVLDELTALIDKYGIDFKNAGSGSNLKRLKTNFESDHRIKNGDDWEYNPDDTEGDYAHIQWLKTTAASTDKLIEKLEKHSDKLCIYERRLLEYLKNGNTIDESEAFSQDREFKRTRRRVNIPILIISFGIVAFVQYLLSKTIFNGAFVPSSENVEIFGILLPIPFKWLSIFGSGIMLFAFLSYVAGRFIIRRIIPDYAKGYAEAKYAINDNETKQSKLRHYFILPVAMIFLTIFFIVGGNVGIAFYDDYVVDYYVPSRYEHISYDKVELYAIENDENGEKYNGVCYAVCYGDDYAVFAPCRENSKADEKIKEIAKAHGKTIIQLEDKDELAEFLKTD